jgi:EAL domain-containing protein (putative c-di-GMP-specific phosphodiesterase class I)
MTRAKREALKMISGGMGLPGDRAGLEASFEKALNALVLNFQPIISWQSRSVYAYEVLIRSTEPTLPRPLELFEAAEKLDRAQELGRAIRGGVAKAIELLAPDQKLFVNLHPRDLEDRSLYTQQDPLAKHASRVVLEVSERASLDLVKDARTRIASLRSLGYKIAMDDLGAGHAGLATFAHLEPDVVKLDMALVRGSDKEPLRRKLIRSISELCRDLQMEVITEGIETAPERDAVVGAGCDLLQGYLFGRPEKIMAPALWI